MSLASDEPMSTWLVTGASGFLGTNLGYWLGGRVTRIGISRSLPADGLFDQLRTVDLTERKAVLEAVAETRPDVIVNTAAFASHEGCENDPDLARTMNVEAARTVAEAATRVGARLVHISTDAVFDGARGGYREVDAPNPFSTYGETKLLGESAVLDACPAAAVARTNFFGWSPSASRSILEFFVNSLRAGTPVRGFTDFVVTSIYAQHLAAALFEVAALPFAGVLHVTSANALSKYDFGVAVADRFGLDGSLIAPTSSGTNSTAISRSRDISLNTDQLAALLQRRMATQEEGIGAAYEDRRLSAVFAQNP